jgi:hypothetical protein
MEIMLSCILAFVVEEDSTSGGVTPIVAALMAK